MPIYIQNLVNWTEKIEIEVNREQLKYAVTRNFLRTSVKLCLNRIHLRGQV